MRRLLLVSFGLLAVPAVGAAQFPAGFGGPVMPGPAPRPAPMFRPAGLNGPAASVITPRYPGIPFPYSYIWGGSSYYPYYGPQYSTTVNVNLPPPFPAAPVEPTVPVVPELPAVLVVEFPAAAELWVNGKKAEGEPAKEWTLTSPAVGQGGSYTFDVKARWKADGKTLEA